MRLLWTFVKIVVAVAIMIPLSIIVLAAALGILGAMLGLAILALKVAVIGLVGLGAFKLIRRLLVGPAKREPIDRSQERLLVDPHYEAAMRELDRELGVSR